MANLTFLHGGDIYGVKGKGIIDFSANINPVGLPSQVKGDISRNFEAVLHYPDPQARGVRRKIAGYWKIDEQNILLGNGSAELIYLAISAYRPRTMLIPIPAFSEYERAARNIKSKMQFLKLGRGFELDLPQSNNADMVFICNPNNPTGNLIVEDRRMPGGLADKLVVVDEAFMDFLPNQNEHTFVRRATRSRKIIVLRTLTKFFALPGLRIGYCVAHKEAIAKLKQYQHPWSTNCLAQLAAELVLGDKEYINRTYRLIAKERRFLINQLATIKGLRPYPSVANFILIKIEKEGITSKALKELLITRGVLIRDCSNFRGLDNRYIRVAVRSRKENLRLLAALRKSI